MVSCKHLGDTDVQIPEIGLGTWKYQGDVTALQKGLAEGATFIDTAEIYGTEEIVGKAVRGIREQVFLATKVAPRHFRRGDLIAAAESSLRRLNTEYIDLYQLHWPNSRVPIEESVGALEDLVDSGKIRFIGVSNFSLEELRAAQAATTRHKIVSNQVRYSLIDRTVERELLRYCEQNNITVIAYSPLGTSFQQIRACDPNAVLAEVAVKAHKTEAQVALNWLIAKNNVVAIPQSSHASHVVENCGASGWRLSHSEYDRLEEEIRCAKRGPARVALSKEKRRIYQFFGRQL